MTRALRLGRLAVLLLLGIASLAPAAEKPTLVGARLGLGDRYKLGCWAPLRVFVEGGSQPRAVQVVAITPDSDGVGVATSPPAGRPVSAEPGVVTEQRVYVRVGQYNAPVETQLYDGAGRLARRVFTVGSGDPELIEAGAELAIPTPSTGRLFLQLGGESGLSEVVEEAQNATNWDGDVAVASVTDAADLPRDPIGYDSFDAVVLVAGARAGQSGGDWLGELTADDPRTQALVAWVESGGRLILSCGAGGADLLAPGGALAELCPGGYDGPQSVSVATAIERYADAPEDAGAIDLLGGVLTVSGLRGVNGVVETYAGRSDDETPLVVRTPRGFGELTLVAFDLDAPAIAGWEGRSALVRKLLRTPLATGEDAPYLGYQQDAVGDLLDRLDNAFAGVRTAPFLVIVGLVVLYLLLIGPGDYFFVKKVLRRVEATWVTFPLIVAATSGAAYLGAYWLKGDKLRVNQVEFVDVDAATGRARGRLLTHVFSPRASRYNLALEAKRLDGGPLEPNAAWTAWLGKSGGGLGGMHVGSVGGAVTGVRPDYQVDPTPLLGLAGGSAPSVVGMPVQVWSTKSLVSRYEGRVDRSVDSRLTPNEDGLVSGSITNDTGARLTNCRLLYGTWAWRLGDLADGQTVGVDDTVDPLRITTLLGASRPSTDDEAIRRVAETLAVGSLGSSANKVDRAQWRDLELSHLLEAGRALLLAQVAGGPRSELLRDGGPLVPDEPTEADEAPSRKSWVFARFILPVNEE